MVNRAAKQGNKNAMFVHKMINSQPQPVTYFENKKPNNVGTKKQTGGYDFLDKPPTTDQ